MKGFVKGVSCARCGQLAATNAVPTPPDGRGIRRSGVRRVGATRGGSSYQGRQGCMPFVAYIFAYLSMGICRTGNNSRGDSSDNQLHYE